MRCSGLACAVLVLTLTCGFTLPGDDPPLARLMRRMMAHAENTKLKVEAGKRLGELPKEWHGLAQLESSQENAKGLVFEAMAASYLNAAQRLHTRNDAMPLRQRWNATVQACLNCHVNYCPGPVKRIERLRVTE